MHPEAIHETNDIQLTKKSASNAENTSLGKPGSCSPLGDGKLISLSDLEMVILQPKRIKNQGILMWKKKKRFGYGSERSASWITVWWTAAEQVCDLLSFRVHIIRERQTQQVISESLRSADSHYEEATQASSSPFGRSLRASPVSCWDSYVLLYEI